MSSELEAKAWDEGLAYAKAEIRREYEFYRAQIKIDDLTNKQIQPCFDAIDAAGSMSYHQYNAHIASCHLGGVEDMLTFHPDRWIDGEFYEGDEDPNPYR